MRKLVKKIMQRPEAYNSPKTQPEVLPQIPLDTPASELYTAAEIKLYMKRKKELEKETF